MNVGTRLALSRYKDRDGGVCDVPSVLSETAAPVCDHPESCLLMVAANLLS